MRGRRVDEPVRDYCSSLAREIEHQQLTWLMNEWKGCKYARVVDENANIMACPAFISPYMERWMFSLILNAAEEQVAGLVTYTSKKCRMGCEVVETAYYVVSACLVPEYTTRHDNAWLRPLPKASCIGFGNETVFHRCEARRLSRASGSPPEKTTKPTKELNPLTDADSVMTSYGVEGQETERLPEEDFGAYCKRLARRVSDQQVDWLLDKWRSMNYGRLVIKGEECIRFPAYNSFKMEDWIARRVLEAAEEQVHGLGALKEVPCRLGCLNVETAYHVISACGRQTHLTRHDTAVSSIKFPAFNSFKMEDWIARRTLKAAEEQVHGLGSITGAPCWLECQNTETAYHVIGACGMQTHPARHDSANIQYILWQGMKHDDFD
ncbi:hypothetical protein KQX54_012738 [Cotesia glomerata]|uniref:Uncharacterized protein n=1 Tax=Cotesia glomerata TaxID=32391 RepID=A0AAV7IQE0_COTGL|nr:hypothetical protein KQX54_012738 [Cotesia glomerata]